MSRSNNGLTDDQDALDTFFPVIRMGWNWKKFLLGQVGQLNAILIPTSLLMLQF